MNTLKERIDELEQLHRKATKTPWYKGDKYEGEYGEYTPIGPYDMEDKIEKNPYEDLRHH